MPKDEKTGIVYQDRRYVGSKETLGYILFDVAGGFNISDYGERYIYDVLKIDLSLLAIVSGINSVWDIANDTFIGTIVDKTRTRWGKFKPYLMITAIPGTLLGCLGWLMPYMFNQDPMNMAKFGMYLALAMIGEGLGTFRGISVGGYLAAITPHPVDRTRLIMLTQLLSGFFGEQIPGILMGLFIDLINNKVVKWSMRGVYVKMGLFTTLVSGTTALFFLFVSRERVVQSVETPSIMQTLKSVANNKPLMIAIISECLSNFKVGVNKTNYYIDVLGAASIKNIVGIPGGLNSSLSFLYVPWARRRFPTKLLWIVGGSFSDFLMAIVFFFGSIGGRGENGWYRDIWKMIPILTVQEFLANGVLGIKRIIPTEIFNESLDYCEWKNGYRTEGITTVAKGFANKILGSIMNTIKPLWLKALGYDMTRGFGKQDDNTKYLLFAFCTIVPFLTSLLGVIPKAFYPLTGAKREQMYEELLARRASTQKGLSSGFSDAEKQKEAESGGTE